MTQLRVIIAEKDYDYIVPIQQKLIELFDEGLSLEVITERGYFEILFSSPQIVDILILSEEFYDSEVFKRQMVRKMILLTEKKEGLLEEPDFVSVVYKYSNLKEIFNAILGSKEETLQENFAKKRETQVILLTSAQGAAGKTNFAFGLCNGLKKNQKKVLYLDAQPLQSFQYHLENVAPITKLQVYEKLLLSDTDIYEELKAYIEEGEFSYLLPFKASLMSLGLEFSVFFKFIEGAKNSGDYDYIVVDSDSSFGEEKLALMDLADRVVFLSRQDQTAAKRICSLMRNINEIHSGKYILICNDFFKEKENCFLKLSGENPLAVSEYIEHIMNEEEKEPIWKRAAFQKAAYLFM